MRLRLIQRIPSVACLLIIGLPAGAHGQWVSDGAAAVGPTPTLDARRAPAPEDTGRVVRRLWELVAAAGIPGASLAEVRGGRIVVAAGAGVRAHGGAPVDTLTVFEGASLTKPIVAAGVLRLAARGAIDLDRPLAEYLEYPDVDRDPRYRRITARMVLSHTTGFPNWRQDGPLTILFEPGSRFEYSGEGFVYLQRVIEHLTGETLATWAQREVLEPARMRSSSLVWEDRFASRIALPHDPLGRPLPKGRPEAANAAWSLHTTAVDYARFLLAVRDGSLLGDEWTGAMRAPQVQVADGVSWGLGVALQGSGDSLAVWHWGDNTGYKAFAILFERSGDGLVYLSNSDQGMSILHDLLEAAFGAGQAAEHYLDYERFDASRRRIRLALDSAMMLGGAPAGIARYEALKAELPASVFDERLLKDIANLVRRTGYAGDAIRLLELNAREYPDSWRAHAALGDAYTNADRRDEAIGAYERALRLDPDQLAVRTRLEKLRNGRP